MKQYNPSAEGDRCACCDKLDATGEKMIMRTDRKIRAIRLPVSQSNDLLFHTLFSTRVVGPERGWHM